MNIAQEVALLKAQEQLVIRRLWSTVYGDNVTSLGRIEAEKMAGIAVDIYEEHFEGKPSSESVIGKPVNHAPPSLGEPISNIDTHFPFSRVHEPLDHPT